MGLAMADLEDPPTLLQCCMDYICDNLDDLCFKVRTKDTGSLRLTFRQHDVFFHNELSEMFLSRLLEKGKVNDQVLTLLSCSDMFRLRRVRVRNTPVGLEGLRAILYNHKLIELDVSNTNVKRAASVLQLLYESGQDALQSLNVSGLQPHKQDLSEEGPFGNFEGLGAFATINRTLVSRLRNIRCLNVSHTNFDTPDLEMVASELPHLESLDISKTYVSSLTPLLQCKHRLKSLSTYGVSSVQGRDNWDEDEKHSTERVIAELSLLRHLDISTEETFSVSGTFFASQNQLKVNVDNLLCIPGVLPNLTSLDISGRDLSEGTLLSFLESHPQLVFLGVMMGPACFWDFIWDEEYEGFRKDLRVTGEGNEAQILEALRQYSERAVYVQKALYKLFGRTSGMEHPRVDVIKLVVQGMKNHCDAKSLGVQMAASACLYNLTRHDISKRVPSRDLSDVVNLTLKAMEVFPNHQQLQKNALLTLCSDRILQEVRFDRYRAARLVMHCLCTHEDATMHRMAVAIISILAAKISTEQTALLGTQNYLQKLLRIVKEKTEEQQVDITLKFTLSALWNLTDESPSTCTTFVENGGLELFMQILEVFPNESNLHTKVLGLINNIAEVRGLRKVLLREDFMDYVKCLYPQLIAVRSWNNPTGEMVAYRSFHPFFPLLECYTTPAVQLWSVWAMQHVCTKNPDRYCPMLIEEGGEERVKRLATNPATAAEVRTLAELVIELLQDSKLPPRQRKLLKPADTPGSPEQE
ncbi:protein zyg-11 homolog [Branchiostoma floridae]|uniref:Protein zyg-11 homolog n=1 Tax=Branchiostoma floridae TaxID=7739 RepID=A0A9J7MGI6_BRAFL|nr:protein zyg-11 homolog [Branchiostoma floridae]